MVVSASGAEWTAARGEQCCDTSSRKIRLQENSARCHWLEEGWLCHSAIGLCQPCASARYAVFCSVLGGELKA